MVDQRYIFEGGKRKPVISAGTLENPDMGFITLNDVISALAGQFGGGPTGQVGPQGPVPGLVQLQSPEPTPRPQQAPAAPNIAPQAPLTQPSAPSDIPWESFLRTGLEATKALGDAVTPGMNTVLGGVQTAGQALGGGPGPLIREGSLLHSEAGNLFPWLTGGDQQPDAAPTPLFTPGLPSYTEKIIQAESGGDSTARNPRSSAVGAGQFLKSTWLEFMAEVHPDTLNSLGEAGALKLREDPTYSTEATNWYAGKAVDVLDSMNKPATDTNIYLHHFLGPGGLRQLLNADPNAKAADVLDADAVKANPSVLGGGKTVQNVIDWASAKMGELDPSALAPIPRAADILPDFSEANNWFDQAAPQALDPQLVADAQLAQMLSGIGSGLSGQVSGGAELFGNLAAGAGAGAAAGKNLQLELQRDFLRQQQEYAMARGGIAADQESLMTAGRNAQQATSWQNAEDQRQFTAAIDAQGKAAKTPQIIQQSTKGLWVKHPDGTIEHVAVPDVNSPWEQITTVAQALGEDSATARKLKYDLMSQTPGTSILSYEMEVMNDLVRDGLGPAIFGEAYVEAIELAQGALSSAAVSDPKTANEQITKMVIGMLMQRMQGGDNQWILQAAQLGHPGALLLVQGGEFAE